MRIIGIDPGTAILGWGIIDADGMDVAMVAYGALTTAKGQGQPARLAHLYDGLAHILAEFRPEAAAVEELFFARNVTTALTVGQARGVILLALQQAKLPIWEYKPTQIKQAVVGYGHASKDQIQQMVQITLALDHIPQPDDAADGLAIAMCHAYSVPMIDRMENNNEY